MRTLGSGCVCIEHEKYQKILRLWSFLPAGNRLWSSVEHKIEVLDAKLCNFFVIVFRILKPFLIKFWQNLLLFRPKFFENRIKNKKVTKKFMKIFRAVILEKLKLLIIFVIYILPLCITNSTNNKPLWCNCNIRPRGTVHYEQMIQEVTLMKNDNQTGYYIVDTIWIL